MTGSWLCESRKFPPFQPYEPTALHDDCHASDWVIALVKDRRLSKKVNLCAHAKLVRRWNARPRMDGPEGMHGEGGRGRSREGSRWKGYMSSRSYIYVVTLEYSIGKLGTTESVVRVAQVEQAARGHEQPRG